MTQNQSAIHDIPETRVMSRIDLARLASAGAGIPFGEAAGMSREQIAATLSQTPREAVLAHLKCKSTAKESTVDFEQFHSMLDAVTRAALSPDQIASIVDIETRDLEDRLLGARRQAISGLEPHLTRHVLVDAQGAQKTLKGFVHGAFDKTLKLAGIGQNILLVGPAGCGKTAMAAQIAEALGLGFSFVSCSGGMSENQLTGWLLPISAGGAFAYVPASFVKAFEEGGLFLIDEIDAADENVLLAINAALANGQMTISQRHENPIAKRHPQFACIAAANTFGHGGDMIYAGRNRLDGATLDRFRAGIIKMDYDDKLESTLIDPAVLDWGRSIRRRISECKLKRVMSTRTLLDFTRQKELLGFGRVDWDQAYFADWTRDELVKIGRA